MTQHKTFPLTGFKAVGDDGTFEAIVSVFNNVDLVNDRVKPGAFTKSLERWKASGDPIPVVWSHQWDDPESHIGAVLDSAERPEGLWVKGRIDQDAPKAAQVHRLLKERRVREFSFAYDVVDEAKADDGVNDLNELDLIEVGPTLKGANPATQLLAVKNQLLSADEAVGLADSEADGQKAWVTLAGSFEERQRVLYGAVQSWADETFPPPVAEPMRRAWANVEATYADRVVVSVEAYGENDEYTQRWYEIPYSFNEDTVELGEPNEVVVSGVVAAKTRGRKAGRVLSTKNEQAIRSASGLLDGVLKSMDSSSTADDDEAKSQPNAKPEEPEAAKGEEPDAKGTHARLLAEVALLNL